MMMISNLVSLLLMMLYKISQIILYSNDFWDSANNAIKTIIIDVENNTRVAIPKIAAKIMSFIKNKNAKLNIIELETRNAING